MRILPAALSPGVLLQQDLLLRALDAFKDSHLWRRDIEITQEFTQFTPFLSFLASFWTKEALRTHQTPTLQLENKQNRVKAYQIMVEQMLKSSKTDENHCKTVNANEKHEENHRIPAKHGANRSSSVSNGSGGNDSKLGGSRFFTTKSRPVSRAP